MHQSPRAEELRVEIRNLVRAGMSDAEIRASMVERHTRRILSIPDGATGQWLGWTPIAALLAGLVVVTLFIKKSLAVEAQQRAT
jgi:cytochrome c-type biogenesis protein CcmH/NrfF